MSDCAPQKGEKVDVKGEPDHMGQHSKRCYRCKQNIHTRRSGDSNHDLPITVRAPVMGFPTYILLPGNCHRQPRLYSQFCLALLSTLPFALVAQFPWI